MDDELRQAFATLSAQMSDVGNDARKAAEMSRETAYETVKMGRRLETLESDVGQLKNVVFGSKPPPPMPAPAMVKRVSQTEGEMSELAGQIIAVKADVASVKAINEQQTAQLDALGAQSTEIKKALTGFLKEHPQLATAFVAFVMALLGFLTSYLSSRTP